MKHFVLCCILLSFRLSSTRVIRRRELYTFEGQNFDNFKQDSYSPPPVAGHVSDAQPQVAYGPVPEQQSHPKPPDAYGPPPSSVPQSPPQPSPTVTEYTGTPPEPSVVFAPPPPLNGAHPTASYGTPLADDGTQAPPAENPGGYSNNNGGTQGHQYGPPPAPNPCGHCGGYGGGGGGGKVTFSQLIQSYTDVVNAKINAIFGVVQNKIQLFQKVLEGIHSAVHVPGTEH